MKNVRLIIVVILAVSSLAQEREEREKPDPNDIRSFETLFGRLERDLSLAVQKQDQSEIANFLAPEFISRDSSVPTQIVSRSQWIQRAATTDKVLLFEQRNTIIRAFMGVALVSFVQEQTLTRSGRKSARMLTDVWAAKQGKWLLAQRFSAVIAQQTPPATNNKRPQDGCDAGANGSGIGRIAFTTPLRTIKLPPYKLYVVASQTD
jgi:hypothetical protein